MLQTRPRGARLSLSPSRKDYFALHFKTAGGDSNRLDDFGRRLLFAVLRKLAAPGFNEESQLMTEQKESSVLFSLKELMTLEEDRIKEEEAHKEAQARAEREASIAGPRTS